MDELYEKYAKTVFRYLYSLTHDRDLSGELTQETFYQAVRTIESYDESCAPATWLCGIARNTLRTWQRKHPVQAEIAEWDSPLPSAEEEALKSMQRIEILKKLHAMEDPWREVLYLRIYGDLSCKEIAAILSRSETWVRVTYYRAKEKLRKELENETE